MLNKLKTAFNASIIFSIMLAILGIIMIVNPRTSLEIVCTTIAIYIIVKGIFSLIMYFNKSNVYLPVESFVSGIVSIILGVVLLQNPNYLNIIVGLLLGIWIILESVNDINISIKLRKTNAPWLLTLCLSIFSLMAGIILICNPQESAETLVIWSGIVLLINSIVTCLDKIIFKRYAKEFTNAVKALIEE